MGLQIVEKSGFVNCGGTPSAKKEMKASFIPTCGASGRQQERHILDVSRLYQSCSPCMARWVLAPVAPCMK